MLAGWGNLQQEGVQRRTTVGKCMAMLEYCEEHQFYPEKMFELVEYINGLLCVSYEYIEHPWLFLELYAFQQKVRHVVLARYASPIIHDIIFEYALSRQLPVLPEGISKTISDGIIDLFSRKSDLEAFTEPEPSLEVLWQRARMWWSDNINIWAKTSVWKYSEMMTFAVDVFFLITRMHHIFNRYEGLQLPFEEAAERLNALGVRDLDTEGLWNECEAVARTVYLSVNPVERNFGLMCKRVDLTLAKSNNVF